MDVARGKTRPVAISPLGPVNGRKHCLGPNLTDVKKVIFQHPLLDRDLRARLEMLHRTTTADTKAGATRFCPERRGAEYCTRSCKFVLRFTPQDLKFNSLARQGTLDEHHLAGSACDPAALVIERFNFGGNRRDYHFRQAKRPKIAASEPRSRPSTSSGLVHTPDHGALCQRNRA